MGAVTIKGITSGGVSLVAPDSGSDVTLTLPGVDGELLPLGGGKILQIVRATDSTARSTSSTSMVDANISVTITPQKSDSAILLLWNALHFGDSSDVYVRSQITDNSNNPISGAQANEFGRVSSPRAGQLLIGYATPATTSAVTHKGRFSSAPGNLSRLRNDVMTGQMYAIEVSA